MQLFLCEKPSQAKDIATVLGVLERKEGYYASNSSDIVVTWAFGHLLAQAMPEAYGDAYQKWGNIDSLPIFPAQWKMEIIKKSSKQFSIIKKLLESADEVVIATDADREGEVIAREILNYCHYGKKISRFWTSGLDEQSVKKALLNIMPGEKTENLYFAGLARSRADWLVGMNLSRAYTVAYASGYGKENTLSIGRIQTPTLSLVVHRDHAIDHFKSYPYYELEAKFTSSESQSFTAQWQMPDSVKNTDGFCIDKAVIDQLAQQLKGQQGTIVSAETERKTISAPLPYNLSVLQKEASKLFNISTSKVLEIAQSLYEKHKITSYPRTPCQYLPNSQQRDIDQIFDSLKKIDPSVTDILDKADSRHYGRVWNDKQVNKHSHHAIIPTMKSNCSLDQLNYLEKSIYIMVRNRYIAQFYPDYEYDSSAIVVCCNDVFFRTIGQIPRVWGWKMLLVEKNEKEHFVIPNVSKGDIVDIDDFEIKNKKTTPLARFTESSLLDEMANLTDFFKTVHDDEIKKILKATDGLGTVATRGNIIDRLFEMSYIEKKKNKIYATEKGKTLIQKIPVALTDPVTTAKWEIALAGIESRKISLEDFMRIQQNWIDKLVIEAKIVIKERKNK